MLKILLLVLPAIVYCLDPVTDCSEFVNPTVLGLDAFLFQHSEGDSGWLWRPLNFYEKYGNRSVHQVIPGYRVRQLYNTVVNNARDNGEVMHMFGLFLKHMVDSVINLMINDSVTTLSNFTKAFKHYGNPTLRISMLQFYVERKYVLNAFYWLPGNLFLGRGPQPRNHDATSNFKVRVQSVFDPAQFTRLENLNRLISVYVNQSNKLNFQAHADTSTSNATLTQIITLLDDIVTHNALYIYDKNVQGNSQNTTAAVPDNIPFEMMQGFSCKGTNKTVIFHSADGLACLITRAALTSIPDRLALDSDDSGSLKTINFKDSRATWLTNNTGLHEDYYIIGKVEDVFYNVTSQICYIAVDDDHLLYKNRFHDTKNQVICYIAVEALINDDRVVVKARPDLRQNETNDILNLYIEKLCKN